MNITAPDGTRHEVEGLDLNVYGPMYSGNDRVKIAAYELYTTKDGYQETNTRNVIFVVETNLNPDEWEDSWFSFTDETKPGDIPPEVIQAIVNAYA